MKEAVTNWIRSVVDCAKKLRAVSRLNDGIGIACADFTCCNLFNEFEVVNAIMLANEVEELDILAEALELPVLNNEGKFDDITYYYIKIEVDGEDWYLFTVKEH